jgi:hypothetical protein
VKDTGRDSPKLGKRRYKAGINRVFMERGNAPD